MDIEMLIDRLNAHAADWAGDGYIKRDLREAADALEELQAENEKLRADVVRFNDLLASYQNVLVPELRAGTEKLRAELEQVKRELDAAKSPEVLEAVDELMEFARTRMGIAEWLYYVDVLGEWRGPQKED